MNPDWRPAQPRLRAFCTAMPVLFGVSAVLIVAVAVPATATHGWRLVQLVVCAAALLALAGLLLWVRRLVVNGYVDVNIAVPRAKAARSGAFLAGMVCLIGLIPTVSAGDATVPVALTAYVAIAAFLTVSGLVRVSAS
ncbi:hypothetical protein [Actinocrispum wychmicini]|uniref:Uncharacterized protein n=1 Tax=Actinocrispum wychmicini TaxID=1213861 RepID=A0A4R2JC33_9PSEU|nr:hypothetical protein [Actinocrispum wychmicini]TCO57083.1 hypothetical protein EV192_106560 [Actinocrispum wychmicini]